MENIKLGTTGQKHISTIATDIKQLISDISTGKPANMTEENLNVFLNNIKEAILAVIAKKLVHTIKTVNENTVIIISIKNIK